MRALVARAEQAAPARLHLGTNDLEMTGDIPLYRPVGRGFLALIELMRSSPLPGLTFSTAIVTAETHVSGVFEASCAPATARSGGRRAEPRA